MPYSTTLINIGVSFFLTFFSFLIILLSTQIEYVWLKVRELKTIINSRHYRYKNMESFKKHLNSQNLCGTIRIIEPAGVRAAVKILAYAYGGMHANFYYNLSTLATSAERDH